MFWNTGQRKIGAPIFVSKTKTESEVASVRKKVHIGMAILLGVVIVVFRLINNQSVIKSIYTVAGYTYGPLLGLFAFGIFTKRNIRDRFAPIVAVLSPVLCYIISSNSEEWMWGYKFGFEILILNGLITFIGLLIIGKGRKSISKSIE